MHAFTTKILTLLLLVCGAAVSASAAWYWPFDPDSTNKPPRLHRLLEQANEYIELAEDEALDGNGDKAIENYRLALKEIDRVELENPDRADTAEFAPLRNKRATCSAAIDAIRFAQVNENERAVAVSNTTKLERRWRLKHGLQTLADEIFAREEAAKTNTTASATNATNTVTAATNATNTVTAATNATNTVTAATNATNTVTAATNATNTVTAATNATNTVTTATLGDALKAVRAGAYAEAERMLDALEKATPDDLNVLLIRAAAQAGSGSLYAARRTLERAAKAHPKSYLPLYNLAHLTLQIDTGDQIVARALYEKGRALGGPQDAALEGKLK